MLREYLTIGEFSKITEIPSRTLHFYDQKGLLKPAKVDQDTNYRYYSVSQILDVEFIKAFKFLGVPLKQIEEVQSYSSKELIQFLSQQEAVLEEKVREINAVQKNLQSIKQNLTQQSRDTKTGEVFIKTFEKQNVLKINIGETEEVAVWSQHLHNIVQSHETVHKQTVFGGTFPFIPFDSFV